MREIDEDERREAIDERRAYLRATRCQCGDDMPGRCPGPMFCPLCQSSSSDDDEDEDASNE